MFSHPQQKERIQKAANIPIGAPIAFALLAIVMTLPDIFTAYPMFQTVENIQSKQPLQLFCREGDRGQVLYLKQNGQERKLNESQLCHTLSSYPDYQVYNITLLNYSLDYAPDVIDLTFSKASVYADLPPLTFQHYVDLKQFRHDAKIRFLSTLLWIVGGCLLVIATMYWQKRNLQLDLK